MGDVARGREKIINRVEKTMPTVSWLLTDYAGGTLTASGSPLYLMYDSAGRTYLPSNPTQLIETAVCTTDASTVDVDIVADDRTNEDLGEAASDPQRDPSTHSGSYTWASYPNKRVLLTFTVPSSSGPVWGWNFGPTPPIALRMKIKVKR